MYSQQNFKSIQFSINFYLFIAKIDVLASSDSDIFQFTLFRAKNLRTNKSGSLAMNGAIERALAMNCDAA